LAFPRPKSYSLSQVKRRRLDSPLRWLFTRLSSGFPARARGRLLRPPRLRPVRPSPLSAFFSARLALRSGVGLEDYLQHRLAQRLAALAVVPGQLPVELSVEEGGRITARPALGPARPSPWLDSFLRDEGGSALAPAVERAHGELAYLSSKVESKRQRLEEASRALEEASRGADLSDPRDEACARRMGQPVVPLPLGLALEGLAALLLLALTWQLTLPSLKAAGLPVRTLAVELERDPANALFGALFALGATLALFLIAHLALARRAVAEASGGISFSLFGVGLIGGVLLGGLAAGVGRGSVPSRGTIAGHLLLALVALAIPLCAAWLARKGRALNLGRAEALRAVRAWRQVHYKAYDELTRLAVVHAEEWQGLLALEAERSELAQRLKALKERMALAERRAADAAACEEEDLARLAQSAVAALEQDRYEYLRQASRRGLSLEAKAKAQARVPSEVERNLGLAG